MLYTIYSLRTSIDRCRHPTDNTRMYDGHQSRELHNDTNNNEGEPRKVPKHAFPLSMDFRCIFVPRAPSTAESSRVALLSLPLEGRYRSACLLAPGARAGADLRNATAIATAKVGVAVAVQATASASALAAAAAIARVAARVAARVGAGATAAITTAAVAGPSPPSADEGIAEAEAAAATAPR